jgi:glucose/arabinose dehydrogenase
VGIEHAGDGTSRLFLVDQEGQIRIYDGMSVLQTPFLDLSGIVLFGGEQGLLGLAFHPNYESNGFFFVFYINKAGDIVVARYQVSANPNVANPMSGMVVLTVPHPTESNHNGGQIRFGPDGFLYIATGDGGAGGDPPNNAQTLSTLLGKMLRIDVDTAPYVIPADNPFLKTPGARGEIWSYGLRNPWRFTFDRATGDMFIADVGQGQWEEIDFEPASTAGRNYGWRLMEGTHCFNPSSNCNDGSLVLPIMEYPHSLGCSVTGGFRNRGAQLAAYVGTYFFADFCSGRLWGATVNGEGSWTAVQLLATGLNISTFGEDDDGNLYVAHHSGGLYRLHTAAGAVTQLTISKAGNGSGLIESSPAAIHCGTLCGLEANGTKLTLSVTPASGTVFSGWSGDPDCQDGSISLTADRRCVAQLWSSGLFTDEPLVTGVTPIRVIHIMELRGRIDAQRVRFGLQPFVWSDSSLSAGTPVRAAHVLDLRTALAQAYDAAKQPQPPAYTDPDLAAGTPVRALHISELRGAVRALE